MLTGEKLDNKKYYLGIDFSTKLLIFLFVYFTIRLHFAGGKPQFLHNDVYYILMSILALIDCILIINISNILSFGNRYLKSFFNISIIILYCILSYYVMRTGIGFDYSIYADNSTIAFSKNSLKVIVDTFKTKDLYIVGALLLILIITEISNNKISREKKLRFPLLQLVTSVSLLGIVIIYTPYSNNQITALLKTVYEYSHPKSNPFTSEFSYNEEYPYIKESSSLVSEEIDRSHVFIIMIESFNANFVESKTPEGKEYTPFFNSLITKGMYFENFYGNSVQTAKGHFATLCSTLPSSRHKVFVEYPNIKLNCLPDILKKNGYETLFFQAQASVQFDNTEKFLTNNGINHMQGMDDTFLDVEDKKYRLGWGLQDDRLYTKFFNYLDKLEEKNKGSKNYFGALATISSHMKFKNTPKDQRYLYPDQNREIEYYGNAIRAVDEYLKTLISEIEKREYLNNNSIVFITADHSFPVGEHGNYYNENAAYEENFKAPLLVLRFGGKNFKHKRVKQSYSQIDIGPTILNYLDLKEKHHFIGGDLFGKPSKFVHTLQPYSGGYIGIISNRYKYLYSKRSKAEKVYNLRVDPMEKNNIISEFKKLPLYYEMRNEVAKVYLNDDLLKNDKIWKE